MKPSPLDIGTIATVYNQDRVFGSGKRYHHVRVIDMDGKVHRLLLTDAGRLEAEQRAETNESDWPKANWWARLWHNSFWDWLST